MDDRIEHTSSAPAKSEEGGSDDAAPAKELAEFDREVDAMYTDLGVSG